MNHSPSVSVVIPCFNDGRFLTEALKSVLSQTLQPIETLVINDGSTDPKTIKLLQKIDTMGVRVIHQENRGLGGARNTGIRNARGKYTYFCDADNVLYPECLANLALLMEAQEDAVAATSRIRILGGPMRGTVWCEPYNPYLLLVNNQWDAGIMLRQEAALRHDLHYDDSMRCHGYEDWDLNIRLVRTGRPVLFHPEPLYQYRVRAGSLLTRSRRQYVEILSYLREKHKECYDPENLLSLKRCYAPALSIQSLPEETLDLQEFLSRQTFQDWVLNIDPDNMRPEGTRYHFFHSGIGALQRLPDEALECAIMALESNLKLPHCVIGVKEGHPFWIANHDKMSSSKTGCYPIAFILRTSVPPREPNVEWVLGHCEQVGYCFFPKGAKCMG
jgi:glycosyltransferase involved in cell wall biosynthesis